MLNNTIKPIVFALFLVPWVACATGAETNGAKANTYTTAPTGTPTGGRPVVSGGTGGTGTGTTDGNGTNPPAPGIPAGVSLSVADANTLCVGVISQNVASLVDCSVAIKFTLQKGQVRVGAAKCLDLQDPNAPAGVAVVINDCSTAPSQLWTYDQGMLFATNAPGNAKCVGVAMGNNPGSQLVVNDCSASSTNFVVGPEGLELMANAGSNRCLSADGNSVQMQACDGSDGQHWILDAGAVRSAQGKGLCLEMPASTSNGEVVLDLVPCTGADAQTWGYEGVDGSLRLDDASGRCVAVGAGDNTQVVSTPCTGSQDWAVELFSP